MSGFKKNSFNFFNFLWDLWCFISLIGIWPRWIEPNLLKVTQKKVSLPNLPLSLNELKIIQISDLHLNPGLSPRFLTKLLKKIHQLQPDLIVFTGDFLCYSQLGDKQRLKDILCAMKAPYGCYAILGNHDYAKFVSINSEGDYDIVTKSNSSIVTGFQRLVANPCLTKRLTKKAQNVPVHSELIQLLKETPFKLLHNENLLLPIKNSFINLCGLGEYSMGHCQPVQAFKNYHSAYPGIILTHNPDAIPLLESYPGEITLCGHTHGYQINLPGMRKRFTLLENEKYARGIIEEKGKWIYVNRGLGGVLKFRWFSTPEILLLTLTG
jgi:uncharacterized protein